MPIYQYDCGACGTFACLRPMAESELSASCPYCGVASPRLVSAPHIRGVRASLRVSLEERNERSAHEPKVVRHIGRKNQNLEEHGYTKHQNRLAAHDPKHGGHKHGGIGHVHRNRPWMVGH